MNLERWLRARREGLLAVTPLGMGVSMGACGDIVSVFKHYDEEEMKCVSGNGYGDENGDGHGDGDECKNGNSYGNGDLFDLGEFDGILDDSFGGCGYGNGNDMDEKGNVDSWIVSSIIQRFLEW